MLSSSSSAFTRLDDHVHVGRHVAEDPLTAITIVFEVLMLSAP